MLSYLARIIPAYLRAWAARDRTQVSRLQQRVWPTQIDLNMHMNQSVYPQVMEAGRLDLVVRSGALNAWRAQGATVVMAHQHITYRRELRLGAAYLLDTRAVGVDGRILLLESHFLVGERVHAAARVGLLSVGPDGVLSAEAVAAMAAPYLVEALEVEDWRVVGDAVEATVG
ncbi:MAG: hypothetical protein CL927_07200 [Deltaproteobacteria bacterium]|nr:hypothetical protein [Deltaproteobacteria bacterium]HCH61852.1 hypothetical protein [Deltaproteobacteria bacterium]